MIQTVSELKMQIRMTKHKEEKIRTDSHYVLSEYGQEILVQQADRLREKIANDEVLLEKMLHHKA